MSEKGAITEIETKMAFQEKTIQELSDVVFEQQKELDILSRTVNTLTSRLREIMDMLPGQSPASDEKPPHY